MSPKPFSIDDGSQVRSRGSGARSGARLRSTSRRLRAHVIAAALALSASACTRPAPDATPEGVARLFVERMEASIEDPRVAREAYALLGPQARENLAERARRTSHLQGRRVDPSEMLVGGRFGLRFRPKQWRANVVGDMATVDVTSGDSPNERASVRCVREGGVWRVEPELPEVTPLPKREGS